MPRLYPSLMSSSPNRAELEAASAHESESDSDEYDSDVEVVSSRLVTPPSKPTTRTRSLWLSSLAHPSDVKPETAEAGHSKEESKYNMAAAASSYPYTNTSPTDMSVHGISALANTPLGDVSSPTEWLLDARSVSVLASAVQQRLLTEQQERDAKQAAVAAEAKENECLAEQQRLHASAIRRAEWVARLWLWLQLGSLVLLGACLLWSWERRQALLTDTDGLTTQVHSLVEAVVYWTRLHVDKAAGDGELLPTPGKD